MITSKQLLTMENLKISKTHRSELVSNNIEIESDMPIIPRFFKYIEEIKNPYYFLCGEIPVKIEYSKNGKSLEEAVTNCLINMKNK